MKRGCQGCQNGEPLPFEFTMAFHPILDLRRHTVWGYEALVRGLSGQGAGQILALVDEANRYKFDQACRVKAIELASSLFVEPDTRLSINWTPPKTSRFEGVRGVMASAVGEVLRCAVSPVFSTWTSV